ncbi:MAG: hypothetical protein JRG91_11370 [Deltaproteobacteria bacterium]|nr:hypothetical protein [Deltaproteobacteria bacterium]
MALSCGPGGTVTDAGADGTPDGTAECTPGSEIDLEGWWALRAFIRLEMVEDPLATVHVCDDLALATVTWIVRADAASGGDASFTYRTCDIQLPQVTVSFAECSMDETFVAYLLTSASLDASLPVIEYPGTLGVTVPDRCAEITTNDIFVRIGILADYDDAVPLPGWDLDCTGSTSLECVPGYESDVQDTDSDGHPGATFEIDTDPPGLIEGFAWATLRHLPNLRGTVRNSTLVEGVLEPVLEYDFVGSDATMAGLDIDTPTVKRNLPEFVPLADGSRFVLVRVDGAHGAVDLTSGGSVTCNDVLSAPGLFD